MASYPVLPSSSSDAPTAFRPPLPMPPPVGPPPPSLASDPWLAYAPPFTTPLSLPSSSGGERPSSRPFSHAPPPPPQPSSSMPAQSQALPLPYLQSRLQSQSLSHHRQSQSQTLSQHQHHQMQQPQQLQNVHAPLPTSTTTTAAGATSSTADGSLDDALPDHSHHDTHRMLLPHPLEDPLVNPTHSAPAFKHDPDLYSFVDLSSPVTTTNRPHVQLPWATLNACSNGSGGGGGGNNSNTNGCSAMRVADVSTPQEFSLSDMLDLRITSNNSAPLTASMPATTPTLTPTHTPTSTSASATVSATISASDTTGGICTSAPLLVQHEVARHATRPARADGDITKPINALGPLCFAGFYLVTLTRTLVRNRMVPHAVRAVFLAPQLHFGFTMRDRRDGKWRHVHTVQIPYDGLTAAGNWLRLKLAITHPQYTFKHIKDALQKAVADAWADGAWGRLVDTLAHQFDRISEDDINDALDSDAVSSRASGTPAAFFALVNCHKGAPDIRRDVDGAISARESLKTVLAHLGLNEFDCNISIARFRDEVFPLWKRHCAYVREHETVDCCRFYNGGYFKKIMIHKHLYNINGCTSSYHVKDLFEGLEEVIKVWSNPTGMCVREAKCAAGLRYNVDKSFQSGIRSYSKAKFLEAAPHTANEFAGLERQLHESLQHLVQFKMKKFPKCRRALRRLCASSEAVTPRPPPDVLRPDTPESPGTPCSPCSPGARKRKRQERDLMVLPSTPREQKRQHAHLSLKRKEAAEQQVRQYLELLRADCQKQQCLLESVKLHGEDCACGEASYPSEIDMSSRYPTPTCTNPPVA